MGSTLFSLTPSFQVLMFPMVLCSQASMFLMVPDTNVAWCPCFSAPVFLDSCVSRFPRLLCSQFSLHPLLYILCSPAQLVSWVRCSQAPMFQASHIPNSNLFPRVLCSQGSYVHHVLGVSDVPRSQDSKVLWFENPVLPGSYISRTKHFWRLLSQMFIGP